MENENYESFEGDFEGFEDDYESGIPESPSDERDALTSGEDELSQIVRLINGEDIDTGGSEAKRTREFSTTNIGADGRRDFSSQSDAPAPAQQQAPAEPQTIYGQQVMQVKETAQRVWDDAHRRHSDRRTCSSPASYSRIITGSATSRASRQILPKRLYQATIQSFSTATSRSRCTSS